MTLDEWMKSAQYLPPVIRDFHDAKDVFKALHDLVNVQGHDYAGEISTVAGQCYVIDIFLWWMAKHGYTLQTSRQRLEFRDIHESIKKSRDIRAESFRQMLAESRAEKQPPVTPPDPSGTTERKEK